MRCPTCNGYIPEGITPPITCGSCGKSFEPSLNLSTQPASETQSAQPNVKMNSVFAPWLTIQSKFTFDTYSSAEEGSFSFGPTGFSVVTSAGRIWQQFAYSKLGALTLNESKVRFGEHTIEFPDTLFGSGHLRAKLFFELLLKLEGRDILTTNPFSENLVADLQKRIGHNE